MDRFRDVFDGLLSQVFEIEVEPSTYLLVRRAGDTDSVWIGQAFQPGGNIYAITVQIATVEEFLARTGFKPTEFGRQAAGDPSLMLNLRRGRSPTLATADRILAFIEETDRANGKKAERQNRRRDRERHYGHIPATGPGYP